MIGKPGAVVTRAEAENEIERRFWQTVDRIREKNADKDPDEELPYITEIVEETRRDRYEQRQREAHDRR
jgi:hypothetical protein